jgi:hypothetical protein
VLPRRLIPLRSRLWPTRRYYELREAELEAQLEELRAAVEGHEESILGSLAQLAADQQRLLAGQAELRTRLRRTQGLAARAYEGHQGWPALLETARASERYAEAYTEAEPLISIPIPTYHSPDTLCERALASVRAQTYEHWEAIVVGDHCTDDTEARVTALGDPRIHFHNLEVREHDPADPWERWAVRGSVPRARGIELAQGSWIAPLSHDDTWDADHLVTLLATVRERRAEVVYSQMRVVQAAAPDEEIAVIGEWPPRLGAFAWQSAMFNGALAFLRYDRVSALASEPNDWNLARRAWEAGMHFAFLPQPTSTLFLYPRAPEIDAELAARGLPPEAAAYP